MIPRSQRKKPNNKNSKQNKKKKEQELRHKCLYFICRKANEQNNWVMQIRDHAFIMISVWPEHKKILSPLQPNKNKMTRFSCILLFYIFVYLETPTIYAFCISWHSVGDCCQCHVQWHYEWAIVIKKLLKIATVQSRNVAGKSVFPK